MLSLDEAVMIAVRYPVRVSAASPSTPNLLTDLVEAMAVSRPTDEALTDGTDRYTWTYGCAVVR